MEERAGERRGSEYPKGPPLPDPLLPLREEREKVTLAYIAPHAGPFFPSDGGEEALQSPCFAKPGAAISSEQIVLVTV